MKNHHRQIRYVYDHYSRLFTETSQFLYYITTRGEVYRIRKARKGDYQKYVHKEPIQTYFNNKSVKCVKVLGVEYQLKELSVKLFTWDEYNPKKQEVIHINNDANDCHITNLKIIERKLN